MDFSESASKVASDGEIGAIDDIDIEPDIDAPDVVAHPVDDTETEPDTGTENDVDTPDVVEHPSNGGGNSNNNGGKDGALYICILDGSGKSQRLGYSDSKLISTGSTPLTVCTTETACLQVVSKKFSVKSAEYRGYCKKGKGHSIQLSQPEIERLLGFSDQTHVDL